MAWRSCLLVALTTVLCTAGGGAAVVADDDRATFQAVLDYVLNLRPLVHLAEHGKFPQEGHMAYGLGAHVAYLYGVRHARVALDAVGMAPRAHDLRGVELALAQEGRGHTGSELWARARRELLQAANLLRTGAEGSPRAQNWRDRGESSRRRRSRGRLGVSWRDSSAEIDAFGTVTNFTRCGARAVRGGARARCALPTTTHGPTHYH